MGQESAIKIFSVLSLILLFLNAFTSVLEVKGYSNTIVCLYIGGFALLMFLATISPLILENHISKGFPYLSSHLGKAAFYLILSTLCFGEEMGWLGKVNGISMIICAGLAVFLNFYSPDIPPIFSAEHSMQEI